ncbi:DUF3330 domain-containing protein [Solemya velesiana gill symbiont]|uniref:DUF3330 domain-containing protein n=1 Tax=Solemya velesiana gill symbiont TaxID=1918948 RepID=UPI0010831C14
MYRCIMVDTRKPQKDERVSCEVCLKEIPSSTAKSEEIDSYFYYFCGSECYRK